MPDDPTREEPLSASIGEQLEEKRALDEQAGAERQAAQQEEERIEQHKAAERAEVARHLGGPSAAPGRWRRVREKARELGRDQVQRREWAALAALPVAAAGGFALARWAGRRRGGGLPVPLLAVLAGGWALSRRGLPAG